MDAPGLCSSCDDLPRNEANAVMDPYRREDGWGNESLLHREWLEYRKRYRRAKKAHLQNRKSRSKKK